MSVSKSTKSMTCQCWYRFTDSPRKTSLRLCHQGNGEPRPPKKSSQSGDEFITIRQNWNHATNNFETTFTERKTTSFR